MKRYQDDHWDLLQRGDVTNIPLADASRDVILAHMLFNNLRRPEDVARGLREIYRVLKPGGRATLFGLGEPQLFEKIVRELPSEWESHRYFRLEESTLTMRKKPAGEPRNIEKR